LTGGKIRIGITAGDPAGIGPEVALKAMREINIAGAVPILICRHEILRKFYPRLLKGIKIIRTIGEASGESPHGFNYDIDISMPVPVQGGHNRCHCNRARQQRPD
jgi:4-hydroxy-L-threonine phosphate dehydrogenase PdxA